jgi:hypothetical protein
MDKRTILIALAAVVSAGAAVSTGAAWAHHGWGSYDANKVLTISAPVETLEWADPHAHVMVKYEDATWQATLAPLYRMESRGIQKDMLKPGTPVVIEGYPSMRTEHEMRAERITVGGKTVELR